MSTRAERPDSDHVPAQLPAPAPKEISDWRIYERRKREVPSGLTPSEYADAISDILTDLNL